jgi:hypothetical protein
MGEVEIVAEQVSGPTGERSRRRRPKRGRKREERSWRSIEGREPRWSIQRLVECIEYEVITEDIILTNDIIIDLSLNIFDRVRICGLSPRLPEQPM